MEHLTITTPGGQHIDGTLWKQKGHTSTKRLLVICHGYKSSSDHPAIQEITQKLHRKGHTLFTFNFSDAAGFNLPEQVKDVLAITAHFAAYDAIFLLAGSFGALSATIAARHSPKVKGLITLNGFFGLNHLGGEVRKIFIAFKFLTLLRPSYRAIWRYYRQEFRPADIKKPVLIIHSQVDQTVSIAQSRTFFAHVAGAKKIVTLQKADHELTTGEEVDVVVEAINTWVKKM